MAQVHATALAASQRVQPVVFERGGQVRANSRDVAALFEKRHADVLRAIKDLISAAPGCERNFAPTSTEVRMPKGGMRTEPSYDMDRDGFSLLAMGFSGAKALQFKLAYIEAFNRMEDALRERSALPDLNDPAVLRGLLSDYAADKQALVGQVAALEPKAAALNRLEAAGGSLCLLDAAKALGVKGKVLTAYLHEHGWTFRRQSTGDWAGHASHERAGLLEHRSYVRQNRFGEDVNALQVMITGKGLSRLARELSSEHGSLLQ